MKKKSVPKYKELVRYYSHIVWSSFLGKVDIVMKPTVMRGWIIVGTTEKCYKVSKTMNYKYQKGEHVYYIPKKNVLEIKKHEQR